MELDNGAIIPSGFSFSEPTPVHTRSEPLLRVGVVVAVYNPIDSANISKKWIEYDVKTYYIDISGVYAPIVFPRCYIADLFGSKADYVEYTLRPSTLTSDKQPQQNSLELGSTVLLLCVNATKNQGIIIGGAKNLNRPKDDPTLGHHYIWNFNGVQANVNKDGELIVTFNGATKNDGSLTSSADSKASGTYLKIDKKGVITLSSKDGKSLIIIDRTSNTLTVNGDGTVNITSSGHANIKSSGVNTGAATDATVLGTTFRGAQSVMDTTISANMTAASATLNVASALFASISALHAIPIAGPILAAPLEASVAVSLTTIATNLTSIVSAISSFEGQSASYLSKKNLSD